MSGQHLWHLLCPRADVTTGHGGPRCAQGVSSRDFFLGSMLGLVLPITFMVVCLDSLLAMMGVQIPEPAAAVELEATAAAAAAAAVVGAVNAVAEGIAAGMPGSAVDAAAAGARRMLRRR